MKSDEMYRERLHMKQYSAWFGPSLKRMALLSLTLIAVAVGGLAIVRRVLRQSPRRRKRQKQSPDGQ